MAIEKKCLIVPGCSEAILIIPFIPVLGIFATLVAGLAAGTAGVVIGVIGTIVSVFVCSGIRSMMGSMYREDLGITAKNKLIEHIGKDPVYINTDAYFVGNTAYANGIAFDGNRFHVLDKGTVASFGWGDIRSWKWSIEGYETTNLYGKHNAGTRVAVNANNRQAANSAFQGSGFFVEIADIDNPVWHYVSVDKRTLERWMEIFAQVNEGKIKLAA